MLRVTLKRNWFGPGGTRYRKVDNPHEFSDEFEQILPSDAEFERVEDKPKPVVHRKASK